jgi:acyl-CoA thioester hydrolase
MSQFPFRHLLEIRFRDCDAMRHVNNAVYFTYLEQGRLALWKALVGSRRLEDINFILVHAECDYLVPITLGDEVEVSMRVASLGRSSFAFEYQLVDRENGRLFATARTVQVMYDYGRGRSIPIPEELRAMLEPPGQEPAPAE